LVVPSDALRVVLENLREGVAVMFGLGSQELLVILVIVLVLFGANRLPQLARSLGSSLKEFKKGIDEGHTKEASVSPPSAERGSPPSGERACGQCKSPLEAEWTHCPRCGTASPAQGRT
jgi:sec-independent protein translocase protein TatA